MFQTGKNKKALFSWMSPHSEHMQNAELWMAREIQHRKQ
jgi:hypothetical protein